MTSPQIPEDSAGQQPQQQPQLPQPQQPQLPQPQQPQQPQFAAPQYAAPQQTTPQQPAPFQKTNTLAVVGLIAAFVLAPVGAVLSFIALKQIKKTGEEGRGLALAGAIAGSVFTGLAVLYIIGMIILFVITLNTGGGSSSLTGNSNDSYSGFTPSDLPESSREKPLPLNTPIQTKEWTVVVNSVDLNANEEIAAEDTFNEPAPEGKVFVLVNVTVTYNGNDPQGKAAPFQVEYVSKDGNTIGIYDNFTYVTYPDRFNIGQSLYEGASASGNLLLTLPEKDLTEGVLAVSPDYISGKVFLSLK